MFPCLDWWDETNDVIVEEYLIFPSYIRYTDDVKTYFPSIYLLLNSNLCTILNPLCIFIDHFHNHKQWFVPIST